MAYFAEQLVQRLCVYSIGRKQGIEDQTHQESSDRMVSDRIMAWSCMEFRGMGTLLWGDPDHLKISPVAGTGQTSGCSPSYLQYCSGCDRLGIIFQLFIRTGSRLYQSDVWCRCTWLCRQREYVSSYKQPDPVADPDIWLYAAGSFQIRAYVKIKKMEYNNH